MGESKGDERATTSKNWSSIEGATTSKAWSSIEGFLAALHERYRSVNDGEVATYIPELAKADPNWFGIALATTDGHVYEVGDSGQGFTIQSISKPFAYGLALEDQGRRGVLDKIGVEPTGDAFNSISLAPGTGRPLNPMINAGAIATSSLVRGASGEEMISRLLNVLSIYSGRSLEIDETVYRSEKETGHRNRAIGHMLRNFDILTEDPTKALDVYFKQCSIEVTCRDLAVMAATLANGGVNPATGERALRGELVDSVLSVMMSCGMYDFAGEWLYLVGAPAKSGVAGGVIAVWPGQLGLGVFSPRLDARGNSVRGIAVAQDFSRELGLHALRATRAVGTAIRTDYNLARVRSKRLRRASAQKILAEQGGLARVYELQGDLTFAACEAAVRRIGAEAGSFQRLIIDLRRVFRADGTGLKLLAGLLATLGDAGKPVLITGVAQNRELERTLTEAMAAEERAAHPRFVDNVDRAIELTEDEIIAVSLPTASPEQVPLAENDLLAGLSARSLAHVERLLRFEKFRRGDTLVRAGDAAGDIFLLTLGQVSVMVELAGGRASRLSTLSAGMSLGEIGVVTGAPRTADVRADTAVECYVLPKEAFDSLAETNAAARLQILENIVRKLAMMASLLTAEVAALAG